MSEYPPETEHDQTDGSSETEEHHSDKNASGPGNGKDQPNPFLEMGQFLNRTQLFIKKGWAAMGCENNSNRIMALITLGIFFTSAIYATFAYLQWDATNQTLNEMKRGNRPWVGLPDGVKVQGEPVFEVWSPAPDNTAIVVPVHFEISNVGASPAFGTVSEAFVIATGDVRRTPEGNSMKTACSFASQNSEAGRGSVLLPGGAISMDYGLNQPYPIKLSDIRIVWICVCIVYKDSADVSHHSRFWVRSHVSDSTTPILLGQNGTLSRYKLPVSEWFIHSSDAD